MMNKLFTFLIFLLFATNNTAQNDTFYVLQANNIAAGINNKNSYFYNLSTANYEVPKGNGVHSIFASALWLTGLDAVGNLKGSWNKFYPVSYPFSSGPFSTTPNSLLQDIKWNKLFHVSRNEINYHRANFSLQGYVPIAAIANWPAHGDTAYNEQFHLAPFIDVNNNGLYEPLSGDYPDVPGDDNVFFIVNDDNEFGSNSSISMQVEIHFLFYQMQCPYNSAINNTTFLRASLFNRGNHTYHDVLLSSFDDFDLGCYKNDYIGFDTIRNMGYVYNANIDSGNTKGCSGGVIGYDTIGINSSQAITVLNHKIFSGVGIVTSSMLGDPETLPQARRYQIGNYSYNATTTVNITYTGNPNDTTTWSERKNSNGLPSTPGDRRTVTTIKIDTFAPGQSEVFDFAYVSSMDSFLDNFQIVNKLMQDVDSVQAFYNDRRSCSSGSTGVKYENSNLSFYPNPATDFIRLSADLPISEIIITDLHGREVQRQQFLGSASATVNVAGLASGVYFLQAKCGQNLAQLKFIKE